MFVVICEFVCCKKEEVRTSFVVDTVTSKYIGLDRDTCFLKSI